MSVAELKRTIERRFGLTVNLKTLYRLTSSEPIQRADLEIAGAVAAVLGVSLGDLFEVQAVSIESQEGEGEVLDPAQSRRLAVLFDMQSRGVLSSDDRQEIESLVGEYGRRLHEMHVREYARQRSLPLDEARREIGASFDQAVAWWEEFEADPPRRAAIVRNFEKRQPPSEA